MQNVTLQEIINVIKALGWVFGIIGTLIVFTWGLVGYIWKSFRNQNELEHVKLFNKTDDHETRISTIEGRLYGD